jgi:serine protease
LLAPDTGSVVHQSTIRVEALVNAYRVPKVRAGDYLVIAGTDMNNDGAICDAGEACGAYPLAPDPEIVPVSDGSVGNVDFTTAYRTRVDASQLAPAPRFQNSTGP